MEEFERDGESFVRFGVQPWQGSDEDAVDGRVPGARPALGAQLVGPQRGAHRGAARRSCCSATTLTAEVTLTNRDSMGFRMLIGREALEQGFAVDAAQSFLGGRAPRTVRRQNRGRS